VLREQEGEMTPDGILLSAVLPVKIVADVHVKALKEGF
jgi:hypothetical protein